MKTYASTLFISCAALLAGCAPGPDLSREISAIDTQLDKLPPLQPDMACPTVGFGSAFVRDPDHTTWLDIILDEPRQLDTVVLIPALVKNKSGKQETLGFPLRFTIEAWRDETPGTQHATLRSGGWLYQPIGTYDQSKHPGELTYELALIQTLGGRGSAPVAVSLYYAKDFRPLNGVDVHDTPGVTQIGSPQIHPSWANWSTRTGKHGANKLTGRFDLSSVPAGATLLFRIVNETEYQVASVDDIKLNPPFALVNADFETPPLHQMSVHSEVKDWRHNTRVAHPGRYWAGAGYQHGRVLVDYSRVDYPNPGVAPVAFRLPPDTIAKKIRIRAVRLQPEMSWRWGHIGRNFALNEVMLFDKMENVALNSRTASADQNNFPLMFSSSYAVDGYSYYPPVNPKEVSSPEIRAIDYDASELQLLFDLGRSCTLHEARFYPVDRSPQFSHRFAMGVGFPRNMTLHLGENSDPNRARQVLQIGTAHQVGSDPVVRRLNQDAGRYVWLEMSEGQPDPRTGRSALGLSEVELLENGTNVLAGVQPMTSDGTTATRPHLTDGRTSRGFIVPQKEWLLSLHRRARLEQEKNGALLRQQAWLDKQHRLMEVLKGALLAVVLSTLLIIMLVRSWHRRNLRQLRENIGANLHDAVGANLSGIALSSEMLKHSEQLTSPRARKLIDDITRIAQETATEIRLVSRFLEHQGAKSNLVGQLRRIEQQMLPGLRTHSDFNDTEQFNALTPTEKWELVLFFKEALNNIVKHARATRVDIRSHAEAKQLYLEITDNGTGLPDGAPPPAHLVRRAQKLHGDLRISSSEDAGTTLLLAIPKKRKNTK